MKDIPEWFCGAHLNFAENLLRFDDDKVALYMAGTKSAFFPEISFPLLMFDITFPMLNISVGEGQEVQSITFHQLKRNVTRLASALKNHGVKKGDRIVGVCGM